MRERLEARLTEAAPCPHPGRMSCEIMGSSRRGGCCQLPHQPWPPALPGGTEKWMQADTGPGRTHAPVSWVKATTHLEASEQPVPAHFALRHIVPNPLVSASKPSQSTCVPWPPRTNEWPPGRLRKAGSPLETEEHPRTPCPLLQDRVLQSVLPCPERLWDRKNLYCHTTAHGILFVHSLS